jgi:hypothetical protein
MFRAEELPETCREICYDARKKRCIQFIAQTRKQLRSESDCVNLNVTSAPKVSIETCLSHLLSIALILSPYERDFFCFERVCLISNSYLKKYVNFHEFYIHVTVPHKRFLFK